MAVRLTISTLLAVWAAAAGAAQDTPPPSEVTPASAPASQPAMTPDAMSVPQLLDVARQYLAARRYSDTQAIVQYILTKRDPGALDAKIVLAEAAEAQNDFATARQFYMEVQKANPNHFQANFSLGKSYVMAKYWRQAPAYLERAVRVAPQDRLGETLGLLAAAYKGDGQLNKALETAENSVKQSPELIEAHSILASVLLDLKKFDRAIEAARNMEELARRQAKAKPSDYSVLRNLADVYDIEMHILQGAHNTLYQKDARGNFTDRLIPGKEKEAAGLLMQTMDLLISQSELKRQLALYEMLPIAERAATYQPDSAETILRFGLLLRNTANTEKAILCFQRVLQIDPSNVDAMRELQQLNAPTSSQPSEPLLPPAGN